MNAIDFLIREHDKVRQTLLDITDKSHREETRMKMFHGLCQDLIRHETMEHKVWYPHFRNDRRLSETVQHLLHEEEGAEKAIKQFAQINTPDAWEEQFSKFKNAVENHAREEELDLFPQVEKLFSKEELEKIGREMYQFKTHYSIH